MNKKTTVEQAQKAIDICSKYNIKIKLFLIHGFPGENENTTRETIDFLKHNNRLIDRISLFRWTPLPGSYVFNNYENYGLNKDLLKFENAFIYHHANNWFLDNNINTMLENQFLLLENFINNEVNHK